MQSAQKRPSIQKFVEPLGEVARKFSRSKSLWMEFKKFLLEMPHQEAECNDDEGDADFDGEAGLSYDAQGKPQMKKVLRLLTPMSTHWNSIYYLIERALVLKNPLIKFTNCMRTMFLDKVPPPRKSLDDDSADAPLVAGTLRIQHNPASQCLHRSSVSRIGNAAAHGAASYEQSFFWKRSTDRGDRCEAPEQTIRVQHVKGARSQTRNSQTGITLQCIAYCNKEHSHQNTCSLYTGGNLADTGSLELPPWNPPASWSLPWALHVPSDHYAAAKLTQF